MGECPYGRTFEPDPPPGAAVRKGQEQAARPLVLAPGFPTPETIEPGTEIPLRVLLVGSAVELAQDVVHAVAEAAQASGLDPCLDQSGGHSWRRIPLELLAGPDCRQQMVELQPGDLPPSPDAEPGRLRVVRVELTSPLAISVGNAVTVSPRFVDLLAAALRTLSHLFALYDRPLEFDAAALKQAAESVPLLDNRFAEYTQPIMSNRGQQRHRFRGVVGSAAFGSVPLALLPWLAWGGRLHTGQRRMAGAGGWRVAVES